jgi:hypothetical protein
MRSTSRLVIRARANARETLHRIDDENLRRGRKLMRRLRRNPPDIVYLGDSTTRWTAPDDHDQRRLDAMVSDLVAPRAVHSLYGGGYHGLIFEAFMSVIAASPARPVLIVPICSRNNLPSIAEHPAYRFEKAQARLRAITAGTPGWRIRAIAQKPTAEEFDAFYRIPFPTLLSQDTVIGDYARPLRDRSAFAGTPAERERLIYAYHQTASLADDTPPVNAVTRLAATARAIGCQLIAYETPAPVERAAEHFGHQARDVLANNFAVLRSAVRKGSPDAHIVESGLLFSTDEFIEPAVADEHLNERGRRKLAGMLADAVRLIDFDASSPRARAH